VEKVGDVETCRLPKPNNKGEGTSSRWLEGRDRVNPDGSRRGLEGALSIKVHIRVTRHWLYVISVIRVWAMQIGGAWTM
jgi:hypothetical protein